MLVSPPPLLRHPTDYIPNSPDSSQPPASRQSDNNTAQPQARDQNTIYEEGNRPKVVRVMTRIHGGKPENKPYTIKPSQVVNNLFLVYFISFITQVPFSVMTDSMVYSFP